MRIQDMAPPAYVHVNQFVSQYGALLGALIFVLGVLYVLYGFRHLPIVRAFVGPLSFIVANVTICGLVLYIALGQVRSKTSSLVDLGFLTAHVIVIGVAVALVAGLFVGLARRPSPEEAMRRRFWFKRFGWGLFAAFVAGPLVGVLMELALSRMPALHYAPPGQGLLIIGEVFGALVGWIFVAPLTGFISLAQAYIVTREGQLPRSMAPGAGIALVLLSIMFLSFVIPLSHAGAAGH